MNNVVLVGRLGKDPEVKESVVKFAIATNDGFGKNKKTNWHTCVVFGKLKDIISNYVKKGNEIAISGSIDYYKSDDGKYFTSIVVRDITLIGGKPNEFSNSNEFANDEDEVPF